MFQCPLGGGADREAMRRSRSGKRTSPASSRSIRISRGLREPATHAGRFNTNWSGVASVRCRARQVIDRPWRLRKRRPPCRRRTRSGRTAGPNAGEGIDAESPGASTANRYLSEMPFESGEPPKIRHALGVGTVARESPGSPRHTPRCRARSAEAGERNPSRRSRNGSPPSARPLPGTGEGPRRRGSPIMATMDWRAGLPGSCPPTSSGATSADAPRERRHRGSGPGLQQATARRLPAEALRGDGIGLRRFREQRCEGRQFVVPLDHGRRRPEPADGISVKIPDRIGDGRRMGVDQQHAARIRPRPPPA